MTPQVASSAPQISAAPVKGRRQVHARISGVGGGAKRPGILVTSPCDPAALGSQLVPQRFSTEKLMASPLARGLG